MAAIRASVGSGPPQISISKLDPLPKPLSDYSRKRNPSSEFLSKLNQFSCDSFLQRPALDSRGVFQLFQTGFVFFLSSPQTPYPPPLRHMHNVSGSFFLSSARKMREVKIGLKSGRGRWGITEASVTRNAGGRAMDALRSLIVLNALAPIGTVIVVHHTGSWAFSCVLGSSTGMGFERKKMILEHVKRVDNWL